ncbi:hypothetical protein ACFXHA_07165 [Nocardia sp. NPDC059240]|uniref:hypothetical protein n=1 Tax=Nocardia sp. NPDC059240 TaxID=3346786 RepID=UPI00367E25F3
MRTSRLILLIVSVVVATVAMAGIGVVGLYRNFVRAHHHEPVAERPSWGDHWNLAVTFYPVTPLRPDEKGFANARCTTVGSILVQPGDPVPVRQLTCVDDGEVSTWFTEFADPADLKRYLDAHWVRDRTHETPSSTMALLRPSGPSTPYGLAAHPGLELRKQTVLLEASGDTFDRLYINWWMWSQIR